MNLALWLYRTAAVAGARPALFSGHECVADYAGFRDRVAALAAGLRQEHGIGPGDRVGLFMANCPDYLIAAYAAWTCGAAIVPTNAKLHQREAAWIADDAGAHLYFATPGLAAGLAAEAAGLAVIETGSAAYARLLVTPRGADPVSRDPGDLAWLFYTSGTTGRPKGVMITHGMLRDMSLSYLADIGPVTPEDAILYAAPMSHGAGIYNMIHTRAGAAHVCPPSGGFEPAEIIAAGHHFGRIQMFAAPTMVRRLTDHGKATGERGAGLSTIVYGGGPMYLADIVEAVEWFGPRFVQIYGQGECPMAITALSREEVADRSHPRWRERLGSVGRAQSVVDIRIADAEGSPLPIGESGEIMVRGTPVMPGYWRNAEATARTLKDGWLLTGDVGAMDADGYLTLQDRSKDVIITGGSNVYPREVEECLLLHEDIHEVSVVGRKDADWGEAVVAFVVPRSGADLDRAALDAHCNAHIARFKRPKAYIAIDELPKNNYGKVLKTALRERLERDE